MQTLEQNNQLINYLLGELPETQREELEEKFCHDPDLFEQMLALRDDLIDNYLRGELSPRQLQQFERYFLATPQQRERVENARALLRVIAAEPAPAPPAFVRAEAEPVSWWQRLRDWLRGHQLAVEIVFAVALLIFAASVLLIFEAARLRNQLAQAQQRQQELQQQLAAERERADRAEKLANAPRPDDPPLPESTSPRPEENVIASLTLTSDYDQGLKGSRGGGGLQKLVIPSDRGLVALRLKLSDASYRSYRVTLKEVSSGKTARTLTGLRARAARSGKAVIATFPASGFSGPAKDYLVILDGLTAEGKYETEIDKYSFRVDRK